MEITQRIEQQIIDLRETAEGVQHFYDELCSRKDPGRDQLPMSFFRALAALTLERAEPGVNLQDIRFTASDLAQRVLELGYVKKPPKDIGSDWVRNNWAKLEEMIDSRKNYLQELSHSAGNSFYPWIDKEVSKGGQGNQSYYFLCPRYFNENDNTTIEYACPEGGIRYVQESLSNIPRWARWVNGFTLKSWRKYAYILPAIISILAILGYVVLVLLLGLYTEISTVKWLTCLLVSAIVFWMVVSSPLYSVSSKKIVMAPEWMTPWKETSVQLELAKVGLNLETGDTIRELRLMVYSAKCAICQNRIEVQSGGFQFPFRLVGRCSESPREHVFSFDHVTRTGKRLLQ